jgi:hypothetical protein
MNKPKQKLGGNASTLNMRRPFSSAKNWRAFTRRSAARKNASSSTPRSIAIGLAGLSPGMRKDRYRSDNEDRRKDYATVAIEFLRSLPLLIGL